MVVEAWRHIKPPVQSGKVFLCISVHSLEATDTSRSLMPRVYVHMRISPESGRCCQSLSSAWSDGNRHVLKRASSRTQMYAIPVIAVDKSPASNQSNDIDRNRWLMQEPWHTPVPSNEDDVAASNQHTHS